MSLKFDMSNFLKSCVNYFFYEYMVQLEVICDENKIEDLSIGYHLPKPHILCQNSYGIETIIKLILVPLSVDPLLPG